MSKYSELIYLYLDGEATPEEQQQLFEALSQSEELQREFQQALQIYRAIEAERLVTTAPPELKDSIYAAIGLTPAQPLVRRLTPYVGTSAGIAGLAIGLLLWLLPSPSPEQLSRPHASPTEVKQAVAAVTLSTQKVSEFPRTAEKLPPPTTHADTTSKEIFSVDESLVTDNEIPFVLDRPTAAVTWADPFLRTANWRVGMVSAPVNHSSASVPMPITTQFAYRGSLLAASGPAASPQNFSIAAFYRFDDNNRLGLEFRRAPYTLNIAQPTGTYSTVLLSSVGVSYWFSEPDVRILGGTPFVQPGAAISQMGPLATLTAGLSFPVSTAFHFNVGLDGSALFYSSQVASSLSVAVGFSVGIPLR